MWCEDFVYDESSPSCLRYHNGKVAGRIDDSSDLPYWRVTLKKRQYRIHRVIFEMFNGSIPEGLVVDHKDRDSLNNRKDNLRCVTQAVNAKNKGLYKNNNTGVCGVQYTECFSKSGTLIRKYVASVRDANGKKTQKSFSCKKWGDSEALRLAVEWRENNHKY